jgi:hypothetical protein
MRKKLSWIILFACGMGIGSAQAVELIVSGGELIGAADVNVGGTLYNVEFADGTCAELFSGCNEATDLPFATMSAANQASQALLDQVFVGAFDTDPSLARGCEDSALCAVSTPFGTPGLTPGPNVGVFQESVANNSTSELEDLVVNDLASITGDDTRDDDDLVYARWTIQQEPPNGAPAPGVLSLLALGLVGLGWSRHKRAGSRKD